MLGIQLWSRAWMDHGKHMDGSNLTAATSLKLLEEHITTIWDRIFITLGRSSYHINPKLYLFNNLISSKPILHNCLISSFTQKIIPKTSISLLESNNTTCNHSLFKKNCLITQTWTKHNYLNTCGATYIIVGSICINLCLTIFLFTISV